MVAPPSPARPLLIGLGSVAVLMALSVAFNISPVAMLGFLALGSTLVALMRLSVRAAAEQQKQWARLRAEGKPTTAVVKQYFSIRGHYDQCGVLLEIRMPDGKVGKQLAAALGGGVTFDYLADVCATGRPIEILYLPDSQKTVLKDPKTDKFG